MENMVSPSFWAGKRVLITGHTGFKGTWLTAYLASLGATLKGFALAPNTQPALFEQLHADSIDSTIEDLRHCHALEESIVQFQPQIIFHMAAQPLVIDGYNQPVETFDVNVMGTVHLLQAARKCSSLAALVIVTTDKCYKNSEEHKKAFIETDRLGGLDPYSSSKACCELVVESFYHSYFKNTNTGLATARAGNVIGGGDWAAFRLIPDLIRGIKNKKEVLIRAPKSVRPWQHVLDALTGYIQLAQALYHAPKNYSQAWNFGPSLESMATVEDVIGIFKSTMPQISIVLDNTVHSYHESSFLMLDSSKAQECLAWKPRWNLQESVTKTAQWYEVYLNDGCLNQITHMQINEHKVG